MIDYVREIQPQLLFSMGAICLLLAAFIGVMQYGSIRKKIAFIMVELCVAVLIISDGLSYIYAGDTRPIGYYMVRITNLLVFYFVLIGIAAVCNYIACLYMETGKFDKLPMGLRLGYIIPIAGIIMLTVVQFWGGYCYFDEANTYVRGPLFALSFIAPSLSFIVLVYFLIRHRGYIGKELYIGSLLFCTMPMVAGILQIIFYGYSLINFANGIGALILFWLALNHQNKELTKAAYTEIRSGLPNTAGFMYGVERKIRNREDMTEYSGYYFDIVRMGNYNNKYGKEVGDKIILQYIYKIRDAADKDEIVGRLGGNFFVALIKKENKEKFLDLFADTIVQVEFEGEMIDVHVSSVVGVYDIPNNRLSSVDLMNKISAANLHAKHVVHKPVVHMNQQLEDEIRNKKMMQSRTRQALANNEFEPFYQPKVDSTTNTMVGAEALVRWRNEGDLIPPAAFVAIMEQNGSVCDLDFYMLNRVCKDIKAWIEQGIQPVTVSVNFSRKNLGNPKLAQNIYETVKKYDIPLKYIQIEITETVDEYPMAYLVSVVEALQRYGMTVAIDDFGTGSSSINLLKEVKFDVLKIDKSFISYKNEKEKSLLQNIIKMANDIGISVIAEGVEIMALVKELNQMGCVEIQGYVYDKPLEKSDFETRLVSKQYK